MKKTLAFALCLALLLPVAMFTAGAKSKNNYSPIIVLPGIGQSPLEYYDRDGNLIKSASSDMVMVDERDIVGTLLKNALVPALATLLLQWDIGLSKAVPKVLDELLAAHKTNPDGTLINDLRPRRVYDSVAKMTEGDRRDFYNKFPMQRLGAEIGENKLFFFAYSMMGDAIETAKELDQYIQKVKKKTGCPKVTLVNASLGGSIFVAYLDMFREKGDLDQVVNMVAVLNGTEAMADLYERRFDLNDKYLYSGLLPDLLETMAGGVTSAQGHLISAALHILPRKTLENFLVAAYDYLHTNALINNAQLWALVPGARYPALRERWLSDPDHAALRKKVDAYFAMKERFNENTLDAVKSGVRIDNICGYGLHFGDVEYFVFGSVKSTPESNSDGIIHIQSASQGATAVPAGQKFPKGYKQKKPSKAYPGYSYIAPNRSVDASTCVLPDNTWFFENQHHEAGRNDIMINLATALYTDPQLKNVHSKPDVWPQFNGTARTDWIRKDWLPKAENALKQTDLDPKVRKELAAAAKAGKALIEGSIADDAKTKVVGKRLTEALHAAGVTNFNDRQPVDPAWQEKAGETLALILDEACFRVVGARGFSDWWRQPKYPGKYNGMGVR